LRFLATGIVFLVLPAAVAVGQLMAEAELDAQLAYLFPEAASFSAKEGSPPHYKAFGPETDGGPPPLLGLAF
jgi:hypothetical protein